MADNQKVFNSVYKALKPNGVFCIDFFNSNQVISNLVPHDEKEVENIKFILNRKVENDIIKDIAFTDAGKIHKYQERVQAISLDMFKKMLLESGFLIDEVFGDYDLNHLMKVK